MNSACAQAIRYLCSDLINVSHGAGANGELGIAIL